MCSQFSGGGDSDEALIVFTEADDSPPFESSLIAQLYEANADDTNVYLDPNSCGTTADITTDGPFAVGNSDFAVRVNGLPLLAFPLINFGLPDNTLPVGICGSCVLIDPIVTIYEPAALGTAAYEWDLECSLLPFLGTEFDTQWTIISPGMSVCGLLPDFTWTRRMRITLGY